jgi:hypothetical protein
MLAWARSRLLSARANPEALFQPSAEVQSRRDTIDDLIAGDRERLSLGKRLLFVGATACVSASSLAGNNVVEVRQVWGQQDVYSGNRQAPKSDAAN